MPTSPMIEGLLIQAMFGLSYASTLFLMAAGLSIVFGVTRITNFAHGSLYMLGAYLAYTLTTRLPATPLGFWTGIVAAALVVGVLGIVIEFLVLRRLYAAPELLQLLATFGLVLVISDLTLAMWGSEEFFAPRAPGLSGTSALFGLAFPQYHLLTMALGPLVLLALLLLLRKTRWGMLIRAATEHRELAAALGVNQPLLFSSVLFLGAFLAGLAGALQIPNETVNLQMDLNIIVETFVVVVVGGLGSVAGAFVAALLIGLLHAFSLLVFPQSTLVLTFVVMAVVLAIRPRGLFGAPELPQPVTQSARPWPLRRTTGIHKALVAAALVAASLLPWAIGEYGMFLAIDALIAALFAASLGLMMGMGGIVSFGHAAFFALGAYGAALASIALAPHLPNPVAMPLALCAAVLLAAFASVVVGACVVRLSGVYLAMLTLAFAQICWSAAVHWVSVTGGDNGLIGVTRADALASTRAWFHFVLVVCVLALFALRRLALSPFGLALRAGRDAPQRAESLGLPVRRLRWAAFAWSGSFAGLAGALFAFHKGSVFPAVASVSQSVDGLVMVLLGGVHALDGPLVGAMLYQGLSAALTRGILHWKLILGSLIILVVIAFPQGVVGSLRLRLLQRKAQ